MSSARGLMAISHDVEVGAYDEYLRWHTQEHLPERLSLPGFERARRFEKVDGDGGRAACLIDLTSLEAADSPLYQARLDNPTPWTRRMMPRYSNTDRGIFSVREHVLSGYAEWSLFIRCVANPATLVASDLISDLRQTVGTVGGKITELLIAQRNVSLSVRASAERTLRREEDDFQDDLILVMSSFSRDEIASTKSIFIEKSVHYVQILKFSVYKLNYYTFSGRLNPNIRK